MPVSKDASTHNHSRRNRAVGSLRAMALEVHGAQPVSAGKSEERQ
jgi:hypothetical protein